MSESVRSAAIAIRDQLRDWRRYLHAHPELSGQERETSKWVAARLRELGFQPEENVGGTHGLTATLKINDQPAIALRADMDALPIHEETDVEYASTNPGVMHACGHDAHTSMLLGAAKILSQQRARLNHSIRLIFQPHEEVYPGGAKPMIDGGCLRGVGKVFGLHISSLLPTGQLGTRPGAFMSATNLLDIVVHGKGGHAAMPEGSIDPVVIAAQLIMALQTVVSRSISMTDSAVVTVTQIEAGTTHNVIPENVRLIGTIRALDEGVRARVLHRVTEISHAISKSGGGSATVNLHPGYPVLVNDDAVTDEAMQIARNAGFNEKELIALSPMGGGEDFAYYCQHVPGAFAFLGARNEAKHCTYPHHHPRFNIDEEALPLGAALLAQFALDAETE